MAAVVENVGKVLLPIEKPLESIPGAYRAAVGAEGLDVTLANETARKVSGMVGDAGLEPATSTMSTWHSSQLS